MSVKEAPAYIQARRLLRRFSDAVERGETPEQKDMESVATAFRQILSGEDADTALGLIKGRGRPPKTDEQLELELGGVRHVLDQLDNGSTLRAALEFAGEKLNRDPETVRSWYRNPVVYRLAKQWHEIFKDPRFQNLMREHSSNNQNK